MKPTFLKVLSHSFSYNAKTLPHKKRTKGILVMFGTLGNIDKSTADKGDKIYIELEKDGVMFLLQIELLMS